MKKSTRNLRLVNNSYQTASPLTGREPAPASPSALLAALLVDPKATILAIVEAHFASSQAPGNDAAASFFTGKTSPFGKRRHNTLARSGALGPDARKVGREWHVPTAAVLAFVAAGKAPATPAAPTMAPAPAPVDDDLEGLRGELGMQTHGRRGAR